MDAGEIDNNSSSLLLPLTLIDNKLNDLQQSFTANNTTTTTNTKSLSNSLKTISCGQALSLTLACSAAANSTLFDACHFSAPTAQTMLVYSLLSLHLLAKYHCTNANNFTAENSQSRENPVPKWAYLIISFLDMEANYLSVLAFRYTSLTSITLLDALAIPASMMFSRLFIFFQHRRAYSSRQFFGVLVCIVGLVAMVFSDAGLDDGKSGGDDSASTVVHDKALWGDALALIGGVIYGLNDVIAEKFVKDFDRLEYLGYLGLFGFLLSAVQVYAFEREQISSLLLLDDALTCSRIDFVFLLACAVGCNAFFYVGVTLFLQVSEAPMLNLSLLSSDIWAMVFSVFVQHILPSRMYFVAFFAILSGVFCYESGSIGFY